MDTGGKAGMGLKRSEEFPPYIAQICYFFFIVIPTDKKEKPEVGNMGRKLFTPLQPPPTLLSGVHSGCTGCRSIGSEEVLLILVLLIHINTHNRMEINL